MVINVMEKNKREMYIGGAVGRGAVVLNEEASRGFPEMTILGYLWEERFVQRNSRCKVPQEQALWKRLGAQHGPFKFMMPMMSIQRKIAEIQLDQCIWNSAVSSGLGVISK